MKTNPAAEIELSGHTSSEGEAALNRSLSYLRVKACKDYVVGRGIDTGRISVVVTVLIAQSPQTTRKRDAHKTGASKCGF